MLRYVRSRVDSIQSCIDEADRKLVAARCTPQGTGKLLMWWVGLLWTDVHGGSYLSLVMLHSRKFIGPGPGKPHPTLREVSNKNWREGGLRCRDCFMTEDPILSIKL